MSSDGVMRNAKSIVLNRCGRHSNIKLDNNSLIRNLSSLVELIQSVSIKC
jgi:hypothetical protein